MLNHSPQWPKHTHSPTLGLSTGHILVLRQARGKIEVEKEYPGHTAPVVDIAAHPSGSVCYLKTHKREREKERERERGRRARSCVCEKERETVTHPTPPPPPPPYPISLAFRSCA